MSLVYKRVAFWTKSQDLGQFLQNLHIFWGNFGVNSPYVPLFQYPPERIQVKRLAHKMDTIVGQIDVLQKDETKIKDLNQLEAAKEFFLVISAHIHLF